MMNAFYPVEISFLDGMTLEERLNSPEMPRPSSTTTTMKDHDELPPPPRTLTSKNRFQTTAQRPMRFPNRAGCFADQAPPIRREFVEPSVNFSGPMIARNESFDSALNLLEETFPQGQFEFVISHFEESNDFFIQNPSDTNDLTSLSDELQKEFRETFDLLEKMFREDLPCLAKSSDGCWYRGQILSVVDKNVKVRFVDFGDTAEVEKKTVRQLPKKFAMKPSYAHRCSIKDVQSESFSNFSDFQLRVVFRR